MKGIIGLPFGVRHNNPLNLTAESPTYWKGQVGLAGEGKAVFPCAEAGIRAAVIDLHSYKFKDGCFYVLDFIKRWAPPVSNPTANYLRYIYKHTGLDLFDQVLWPEHVGVLVDAMIQFENGGYQYDPAVIGDGVALGLHPERPIPSEGTDLRPEAIPVRESVDVQGNTLNTQPGDDNGKTQNEDDPSSVQLGTQADNGDQGNGRDETGLHAETQQE